MKIYILHYGTYDPSGNLDYYFTTPEARQLFIDINGLQHQIDTGGDDFHWTLKEAELNPRRI
jgi:hypothetical protein